MIKKNISKPKKAEKLREVTILSGLKRQQVQSSSKKKKQEKEARVKKQLDKQQKDKEELNDIVKKIHKTKSEIFDVNNASSDNFLKSQFTEETGKDAASESGGKTFRKLPQATYKGSEIDVDLTENLAESCYTPHFDLETTKLKKSLTIKKDKVRSIKDTSEHDNNLLKHNEKDFGKKKSGPMFNTSNLLEEDYAVTLGNLEDDDQDLDREDINNGITFKNFEWKEKWKRNMYKTKNRMYEGLERLKNFGVKSQFGVKLTKQVNPDMVIPQEYHKDEHVLGLLNKYVDYVMVDPQERNSENYRNLVIEHIMNHIQKNREIEANNSRQYNAKKELDDIDPQNSELEQDHSDSISNEFCDDRDLPDVELKSDLEQHKGFTRGRVLVVCPYKVDCYNMVATIIDMVNASVIAKGKKPKTNFKLQKFQEEFFSEDTSFDDSFRLGICIQNDKVQLYVPYTKADIIIGSPLGLRLASMGHDDDEEAQEEVGSKSSNSFQSSVEILYIDKAHLLFMQNFEHVRELMTNLNLMPKHSDCVNNFNEIRPYFTENLSQFYRQNIVYTDYNFNELNNLITKNFVNYEGLLKEKIFFEPVIKAQNYMNINFEFMRIDVEDHLEEFDKRFNYFVNNFWERIRKKDTMHKMVIFCNSYFEFVKLKAHFKKVNSPVAFISEYTELYKVKTKIANYRRGVYQYILISERAHFYRICNVRDFEHIFFYSPPNNPAIFSEQSKKLLEEESGKRGRKNKRITIEEVQSKNSDKLDLGKIQNQKKISSVTTLFTKMNNLQIERIVGSAKARDFFASNSKFSTFSF